MKRFLETQHQIQNNEYLQIVDDTKRAINRGLERANAQWKVAVLELIYEYCCTRRSFTANELGKDVRCMEYKTHDYRAIGGLLKEAERRKWIRKTGQTAMSKAGHLINIQIWESLLYKGTAQRQLI